MTRIPFSKIEQIEMLLAGTLFKEIEKLHPDRPAPWKLLTVAETDIRDYLCFHPEAAQSFFERAGAGDTCPNWHDVPAVWRDGSVYKVAWINHGTPEDTREFTRIEDALTRYIMARYIGG